MHEHVRMHVSSTSGTPTSSVGSCLPAHAGISTSIRNLSVCHSCLATFHPHFGIFPVVSLLCPSLIPSSLFLSKPGMRFGFHRGRLPFEFLDEPGWIPGSTRRDPGFMAMAMDDEGARREVRIDEATSERSDKRTCRRRFRRTTREGRIRVDGKDGNRAGVG